MTFVSMPAILSCVGGSIHPGTTPASITLVQPAARHDRKHDRRGLRTNRGKPADRADRPQADDEPLADVQRQHDLPDARFHLIGAPTGAFLTLLSGTFPFTAPANAIEPR
ncbi:hypothetical protein [Burkholderia multivorans]|uniref:hypothetical protein n=1 Tax=Burkholderia multivorans TaxID=87883 RepID=UPI001C24490B|nr:hypothetical protein [Burkholderia multivorans]MBU9223032.1 hypothetical protein [Burkholderia multivorans]MBU9418784.1 hypothetical protein [Burkholderia multivorans]